MHYLAFCSVENVQARLFLSILNNVEYKQPAPRGNGMAFRFMFFFFSNISCNMFTGNQGCIYFFSPSVIRCNLKYNTIGRFMRYDDG